MIATGPRGVELASEAFVGSPERSTQPHATVDVRTRSVARDGFPLFFRCWRRCQSRSLSSRRRVISARCSSGVSGRWSTGPRMLNSAGVMALTHSEGRE